MSNIPIGDGEEAYQIDKFASPIQAVASSDTVINAYGVSVLSGIAARSYTTMAAPIAGVHKWIINKSSTEAVSIDLGVPIAFSTATSSDAPHTITFTTGPNPATLHLIGLSTSLWGLLGVQGAGCSLGT